MRLFVSRWCAVAVMLCLVGLAQGHGVSVGDLVLDHPYAVPSIPGSSEGAAYLRGIRNKGSQTERLLSASSPIAERVQLQSVAQDGSGIRRHEVASIELPADKTTELRHGGPYHLVLMNLKRPLKEGDRFDLTLNFERAGSQTVKVCVQTPRDSASAVHNH